LCRTKASKQKVKFIKPFEDREITIKLLNQVNEYKNILDNKGYFPDFLFEDFEYESGLLSLPGSVLLEKQLLKILHASNLVNTLIKYFETKKEQLPFLIQIIEKVYFTEEISIAINEIIDAEGIVKTNASKDLASIRRELFAKKKEAERKFRGLVNELKKLGWIRESEESFYNGRRVVSILSEYKRSLKGVVHGSSETGKTTFIEPQETVELNNQIAELENDERQEIFKLLKVLTNKIRPFAFLVKEYFLLLTDLDAIRAKSYFAVELKSVLPLISREPIIKLKNAFHPILFLQIWCKD
jgi:DNA mismatch repair protein MutS2